MANSIPLYLKWLVRDPVSGAIVIDPLPHMHQSTFRSYIAQGGTAGNSVISEFSIPLFGPRTKEWALNRTTYQTLGSTYMQRVEAYFSPTASDLPGVWGDPCFSGVITKLPQNTTDFAIQGYDSLKLAEMAATGRMEAFSGRTDELFTYAMKVYGLVFADDFTGSSLNNYVNNTGWVLATDENYNAIKLPSSSSFPAFLYTNTSFANSQYADCAIDADFHTPAGGAGATAAVVAALADTSNYIRGRAIVTTVSTGNFRVDLFLESVVAGTVTIQGQVQSSLTASSDNFHLQLRLIGVQTGATYTWRLVLNGNDQNVTYTYTATPSGAIGVRGFTSSQPLYVHGAPGAMLAFFNKVSLFKPGGIITGNQSIQQILSLQPPIDLFNLAQSVEGAQYRKNAKAGLNNDTLDFQNPVGLDLSRQVRFEEKINVLDVQLEPNAENLATALIVSSSPSPDSGGVHWRHNLAAIKKHGLLYEHAPVHQAVGALPIRKQGDNILINKATPGAAKTLKVLRSIDHAPIQGQLPTPTGLVYREGDLVTFHYPSLGFFNTKAQIIGFTFTEATADMEVVLDQYPRSLDRIMVVDRLKRTVNHLMSNAEEVTGFSQGMIRDQRVVVQVTPYKAQAQNNATQVVANATFTKVTLQLINYDPSNNFSTATSLFTAPVAGYYWVCGINSWSPTAAGRFISLIYVNGSEANATRASFLVGTGLGFCNVSSYPTVIFLNKGDTVGLYVFQNSTANQTLQSSSFDQSNLTIHLWSV